MRNQPSLTGTVLAALRALLLLYYLYAAYLILSSVPAIWNTESQFDEVARHYTNDPEGCIRSVPQILSLLLSLN
jgi:hypothetical protein